MDTRTRILDAATRVFRQKGYEGAGLAEILKISAAPKGSLYHHFPAGKADLAAAAAERASEQMIEFIDRCFSETNDWREAVTTLCFRLAKQFELADAVEGCPIAAILLEGPPSETRRAQAAHIYEHWNDRAATHLERLSAAPSKGEAAEIAQTVITMLQGAWIMARATGSGQPIRQIPSRLPPPF
ncbi:MAG: TetR/AcrR family transcriptional regulator [Pikeienuella sp.]